MINQNMTHLRIEQSTSGNEYVTSDIIHKLYETAKGILDEEALNEVEESQVSLQGSLVVPKAYGDEIDWLQSKFHDLHITAGDRYIRFEDPEVQRICVNVQNWGDGTGCTEDDLYAINTVSGSVFGGNTSITTFNELQYFKPTAFNQMGLLRGCSSLTEVTLPSGTPYIGQDMFYQCSNLVTINNTESVTRIQGLCSCSKLVSINTPNLTSVGNYGCSGCTLLSTIDTSNVTSIGNAGFQNCSSLTNVDLSSCTSIGSNAFNGCTQLTSVDLSNCSSLPGYPGNAFSNCTSLTTVTGLSNIPDMGYSTFRGCTSLGTNQDLVLNLTTNSLSGNVFRDTKFKTVTINGANLTNIFDVTGGDVYPAVQYMSECTKMDFSNTKLTNIGALTGCTSLNTVIYPSTVTNLYWNFTGGNGNATYIVLLATTPPSIEGQLTYFNFANSDCHIYVPDSSLSTYQTTDKWSGDKLLNRLKGISELPTSVTWVTKQSS